MDDSCRTFHPKKTSGNIPTIGTFVTSSGADLADGLVFDISQMPPLLRGALILVFKRVARRMFIDDGDLDRTKDKL